MRLPKPTADPEYSYVRDHDVREWWDSSVQPHAALGYQQRIRLLLDEVQRHTPIGSKVLDVGCAQGTAGLLLAERGYRVTLLDIREAHIRYARDRYEHGAVEFAVGRLADAIPATPVFDAVICTEVIEHVSKPAVFLEQISVRLRSGGSIFLTTPNADYWGWHLPSYGYAHEHVIDGAEADSCDGDAHRYLFSREELISLFRGVGLRAEAVGFALPFWTQGHFRTRHAINLYQRVAGRLPTLRTPRVMWGPASRRLSSILVARGIVR
jgi:2-polyprenyl-3-methyl-5-hydroxy-6-metoxy-1,4-benzoquinol methylase